MESKSSIGRPTPGIELDPDRMTRQTDRELSASRSGLAAPDPPAYDEPDEDPLASAVEPVWQIA